MSFIEILGSGLHIADFLFSRTGLQKIRCVVVVKMISCVFLSFEALAEKDAVSNFGVSALAD